MRECQLSVVAPMSIVTWVGGDFCEIDNDLDKIASF